MEYNCIPYKLEQHLKEICDNHDEYSDLLATWQLNKKNCKSLLANISQYYPHYSEHGVSHSNSIISTIELLLGEESIRKLSPSDTWMLLQAAYLHDFGMLISMKYIEEQWQSNEFQVYLQSLENSNDEDLKEASNYLNTIEGKFKDKSVEMIWPLKIRRYVTLIISDYFRSQHAAISKKYLDNLAQDWGLDLGYNGLIPERLIVLLGEIASIYTKNPESIFELDYITNGFSSDYIHPRFIAKMLRMGDLLDAENNRFNPYTEIVVGKNPIVSNNHKKKHKSTRHILVTPTEIEFSADCPDEESYRETRNFLTWLEEETNSFALKWFDIMPKEIKGNAPQLKKKEILLNGVPDLNKLIDLRFNISQEKAFEIIEGSNIYADKLIFLREIIQNAIDASKLQLWTDLINGKYDAWLDQKGKYDNPFDIDLKIFDNYKIEVHLNNIDAENVEVIVKDKGIGITVDNIKKMCNVGTSNNFDKKKKELIKSMPEWLKPTAGFGIGLQSIFLATNQFTILSKTTEGEIKVVFESRKKNGYVHVSSSNEMKLLGTEVHIIMKKEIISSFNERTYYYRNRLNRIDYFISKDEKIKNGLLNYISNNYCKSLFNLEVYCENKKELNIDKIDFNSLNNNCISENGYIYLWSKNLLKMTMWDCANCCTIIFEIIDEQGEYDISFKGMEVERVGFTDHYKVSIDLFGFDVKKSLSLNRNQLTKEAEKKVISIIKKAKSFYLNKIQDEIRLNSSNELAFWNNKQLFFSYWNLQSTEIKNELISEYSSLFKKSGINYKCFKFDGNTWKYDKINILEVYSHFSEISYINKSHRYDVQLYLDELEDYLNNPVNKEYVSKYKYVIFDEEIYGVTKSCNVKNILCIKLNDNENVCYLADWTNDSVERIQCVNDFTRNELLMILLKKTNYYFSQIRLAIPSLAIDEYYSLAVKTIPRSIEITIYVANKSSIISPISLDEVCMMKKMSLEKYIAMIKNKDTFVNLVNYVFENQLEDKKYSKEEIEKSYTLLIEELFNLYRDKSCESSII